MRPCTTDAHDVGSLVVLDERQLMFMMLVARQLGQLILRMLIWCVFGLESLRR